MTVVVATVVSLVALVGCTGTDLVGPDPGRSTATTAGGVGDRQIVRIGALNAETGAGQPYGLSQRKGIELAVRDLNASGQLPGIELRVVTRDDGTDPAVAKKAMTELIDQERVSAILGPTNSPVAAQVDRIAVAAGVPVLAISNTTLDLLTVGEPVWRVAVTDPDRATATLRAVRQKYGSRKAGLVWDPADAGSRSLATRLRDAAGDAGVEVIGDAPFVSRSEDFGPTVERAQGLGAEILLVAAKGDDARRFFDAVGKGQTALDFSKVGDAVWRVALSETTMIAQSVKAVAQRKGVRRAVVVFDPDNSYTAGAASAFRQAARANGVEIVGETRFTQGATNDFSPAFRAARDAGAQAIFVASLAGDGVQFLQQQAAAGDRSVVVGSDGFAATELIEKAGPAAEGVIGATTWIDTRDDPASTDFVRRFTGAFGRPPDSWAALGYAGVQVLAAAIRSGGGTSLAQLRAGLLETRDVPTVVGSVTFGDSREAGYPAVVQIVRDGRFVEWSA